MDAAAQTALKVRFIKLTVLLNAIVILIAISVLLFFRAPAPARWAGMAISLAVAAGLFLYFLRLYRQTKQWLEEEHRKGTRESGGDGGEDAGKGGERTD